MTVEAGFGLFALGMILTVGGFYIALKILPKYFSDEEEKPEKLWWEEKD